MIKIKLKILLPYLIYIIILLTISYFLNRFFQMLIFILFFNFIQNCFNYRFHAETIVRNPIKAVRTCKIITIIVELIYLIFCEKLDIMLYGNLLIIFSIALFNCILEFSLEHVIVKDACLKDKDILLELCTKAHLSESATSRMYMKYIDNKSYQEIANIESVDIDTIKKSISRSRNKIFKNQD